MENFRKNELKMLSFKNRKELLNLTKIKMDKKITIYTTPTCHFCHMAKDFFDENNITYTEKDASSDLEARKEAIQKSGQMGVPVIDIDGEIIVGFDENRIKGLLGL